MKAVTHVAVCCIATMMASAVASAQTPRAPIVLGKQGDWGDVDAGEEYAVAVYRDLEQRIFARVSDGRGVVWDAPVRIDEDSSGAMKGAMGVLVQDGRALVAWIDSRIDDPQTAHGERDVFYNVLDLEDGTLQGERRLHVIEGDLVPNELHVAKGSSAEGKGMYVLVATVDVVPGSGGASSPIPPNKLELFASTDSGATFGNGMQMNPKGSVVTFLSCAVAAVESAVYVAWVDWREGPFDENLYLQYSANFAAEGSFLPEDVVVDDHDNLVDSAALDVYGATGAVTWIGQLEGLGEERVHVRAFSSDLRSLGPDVALTGGDLSDTFSIAYPHVAIDRGSENIVVAWNDDTFAECSLKNTVQVAVSPDGGETFSDPTALWCLFSPTDGELVAGVSQKGRSSVTLLWPEEPYHGLFMGTLRATVSLDGGLTWEDPIRIAAPASVPKEGVLRLAYSAGYDNYIATYVKHSSQWPETHATGFFTGGFRPQSVHAVGFAAGAASIGWDFEYFDVGTESTAWALLAFDKSDLVELEGKILGLLPDSLLTASLGVAASGTWAAELDDDGAGSTSKVSAVLPAGVTLYAVGLGLDLKGASVDVGSITDVIEIDL